jgi:glucose/arabinose dehydrogenase
MKSVIFVLCLAVMLNAAATVFAQTNPPQKESPVQQAKPPEKQPATNPASSTTAKPVNQPVAKQAAKPKMVEKMIKGEVVSVDAVANTITVKYKNIDRIFDIDPAAKITLAGKEAKLADVPKNSQVTIVYKKDGNKRIALAIK